ncbi:MAG: VTT domain-containing protein [Chloroflexi bacterium]|nr:VTT domain-containing protein [Chloroflexota bacterium]
MDLIELIKTVGYIGLFGIIFAESGLFVGFFLPGDSLLFTAGFLASVPTETGGTVLSLPVVVIGCAIAAIVGDNVGYAFGRRVGRRFFQKDDSRLFKKKYVLKAQEFYDKHGSKTIVLARFVPIVRTFAPIVAGIGEMEYRRFVTYNMLGGLLWAVGLPVAGYFLGSTIPDVDKYLLPIVIVIVVVSLIPTFLHVMRDPELRDGIINGIKGLLNRKPAANTGD